MIRGKGTYSRPFDWQLSTVDGSAPLLVTLHGLRQDAKFCLDAWSALRDKVHLLAPEGPCVHEWGRPRRIAQAWYVYDGDRDKLAKELALTAAALDQIIMEVSSRVEVTELWLAGFSQGAYMALYYGLCHNSAVTVVQACAGNLNINLAFKDLSGRTVYLEHGDDDPGCPIDRIESLEDLLSKRGATVHRQLHQCKHEMVPEMIGPLIERASS